MNNFNIYSQVAGESDDGDFDPLIVREPDDGEPFFWPEARTTREMRLVGDGVNWAIEGSSASVEPDKVEIWFRDGVLASAVLPMDLILGGLVKKVHSYKKDWGRIQNANPELEIAIRTTIANLQQTAIELLRIVESA